MGVVVEGTSVLIRNATVEQRFPGGIPEYERQCPNRTFMEPGSAAPTGFFKPRLVWEARSVAMPRAIRRSSCSRNVPGAETSATGRVSAPGSPSRHWTKPSPSIVPTRRPWFSPVCPWAGMGAGTWGFTIRNGSPRSWWSADPDPFASVAARLKDVPVWIFHGDADDVISVEESRRMAAALEAANAAVRYSEFPGVGHNSWDPAYALEELPDWLFSQRRR